MSDEVEDDAEEDGLLALSSEDDADLFLASLLEDHASSDKEDALLRSSHEIGFYRRRGTDTRRREQDTPRRRTPPAPVVTSPTTPDPDATAGGGNGAPEPPAPSDETDIMDDAEGKAKGYKWTLFKVKDVKITSPVGDTEKEMEKPLGSASATNFILMANITKMATSKTWKIKLDKK